MEEDIKVLEENINNGTIYCLCGNTINKAIENLIARNKELEAKIDVNNWQHNEEMKYMIPKSKVREEIEKLKNEIKENRSIASRTADRVEARILNDQINELYKAIKILEQLLQEGDK